MHMSARVINRRLPTDTRIGQEQATNLITSVFQTLRVSGQAIGPLLGAPALATVGFRMVMTFTGMMFLLAGVLLCECVGNGRPLDFLHGLQELADVRELKFQFRDTSLRFVVQFHRGRCIKLG